MKTEQFLTSTFDTMHPVYPEQSYRSSFPLSSRQGSVIMATTAAYDGVRSESCCDNRGNIYTLHDFQEGLKNKLMQTAVENIIRGR